MPPRSSSPGCWDWTCSTRWATGWDGAGTDRGGTAVVGEQRPDDFVVEAEAAHQLVAGGDLQQLAVKLYVPEGVQAEFRESAIERYAMTVSFSVNEDTVAVEN